MTSGLGSISLTGQALGMKGIGGNIDTDALVDALMDAKSIPQKRLKAQLEQNQAMEAVYQGLKAQFTSLRNTAWKVDDTDSWAVTTAKSSQTGVVASAGLNAAIGSATFTVVQQAKAQVSTVTADADGTVVDDFTQGLELTVGDGEAIHLDLTSGSAEDVAKAINKADAGVRAAVINTDQGQMLQLTSTKTGTDAAFTLTGFGDGSGAATEVVAAGNAQIQVGDPLNGGYTMSSQTNTFSDVMPGVTFTVGAAAVGEEVTISVNADDKKVSEMVKTLVETLNATKGALGTLTGKDGALQGRSEFRSLGFDMGQLISSGVAGGGSLADFGIDLDKDGVITFDADAFAAAYQSDPTKARDVVMDFARGVSGIADDAIAPVTGSVSSAIDAATTKQTDLARDISSWNDRLDAQRVQLTLKYTAMQSALAGLQGKSDWLTSMFDAMNNKEK